MYDITGVRRFPQIGVTLSGMSDCLHIWVPAGFEHGLPRLCARCNEEQMSEQPPMIEE